MTQNIIVKSRPRGGASLSKIKATLATAISLTLALSLFGAAPIANKQKALAAPPQQGDAPSSSENYFAAKFAGITEDNVFDNVTVERLYKGVLGQDGKSVIVLGSARNTSTKNTLQYIQAAAKDFGIKKIYFFDPHLAGDAVPGDFDGADITKAANRTDLTAGKDIWAGAKSSLTDYVNATNNTGGAHLKYIDSSYTSDDTYLFVYDRKAGGSNVVDDASTIVADELYTAATPVANQADQYALKASVTSVFTDAGWTNTSNNATFYDQYHWFRDSGAWTVANANPSIADLGISREKFTVKQVTWFEFINVLNTPGEHYFFCSGSWCGDSRNLYPYLVQEASRVGKTVYLIDFRANSGVGTSVSYFSTESESVKNGIAYIGAKVADLLDPYSVGETNSVRKYHPGGNTTAGLQDYANKTFRSPYAAKYTKPNSSEQGTVTESWVNEDELLEVPYKTSSEWTADVHKPGALIDYEVQTGGINALQTAKARASLSEFFGSANIHTTSGYAPTSTVNTNVSKSDSGCGDENDVLDDVGGEKLIANQGTDDIDVKNYDISIEYDNAKAAYKDSVVATTTVTAVAQKSISRVELDFKALKVDKANVEVELGDNTGAGYQAVSLTSPTSNITQSNNDDEDYQKLIVRLPVTINKGQYFKLTVPYTTGILDNFVADDESAQGFFKRVDNKGIAAIGEPLGAIYWFPNNNQPKDGATYKINLKYPNGFAGVGPGVRTAVSATSSTWVVSQDIASYQTFASIGEYVELSALVNRPNNNTTTYQQYITLSQPTDYTKTIYSGSNAVGYEPTEADKITAGPNGTANGGSNGSKKVVNTALPFYSYVNKDIFFANNNRAADKANTFTQELPQYIQTLESIVGPYPGESAGFVFDNLGDGLGGSASWGAVETKDRPFFTGASITSERTFVHEYAHQWYGDAVRIAGWEDLWLNEGFATYVTDLYYETTQNFDVQKKYQDLYNNTAGNKPWWTYAPAKIETEGDLFGGASAAYNRGALALAALRSNVGDDDFSAILKGWVAQYKGQAASTTDFIAFAEGVSKVNLTAWANDWLYGQVKPAVWPTYVESSANVLAIGATIGTALAAQKAAVASIDGSDVAKGSYWVPTNALKALNDAIAAANAVLNNASASQNDVDAAELALTKALAAFNAAKKEGTKAAGAEGTSQYSSDPTKQVTPANIAIKAGTNVVGKTPTLIIKDASGKTLVKGTDYIVSQSSTKIGSATLSITGIGAYEGLSHTKPIKVLPKATTSLKAKAANKAIKLSFAKHLGTTKVQVQYKLKTAKSWKTKTVKPSAKSLTIKSLKKNKTYQVKTRSYKTVLGKKYYAPWSRVKTVKVK